MDYTLAYRRGRGKFTGWVEKSNVRKKKEASLHYSRDELIIKLCVVFMKTPLLLILSLTFHKNWRSINIYGHTKA